MDGDACAYSIALSISLCSLMLKKRNVKHFKVVYSKEVALTPLSSEEETNKRVTPGSTAFVPSVAGLIIAGEVIKDMIKEA